MRVWLPNENIPGIAMSRSFGDEVAAGIGVIAEPEVQEYPLSENDKFLIMATDGIWEFITSEEVIYSYNILSVLI
jgi:serine/threonine protein phosphatase PrpC